MARTVFHAAALRETMIFFGFMNRKILLSPFSLPILFFGLVISLGTILLHSAMSHSGQLPWVDALFTATSATCVTGLAVVDTGTFFNRFGQSVILGLIQIGGLGIMTFTGLIFYLWRRHISLTDRVAVGQSLLHDPRFALGKFLTRIVLWTFFIELIGALLLNIISPSAFPPYSAVFHAVSAFCNAGFSLRKDSLIALQGNLGINMIIMILIILGGLGFSVLVESGSWLAGRLRAPGLARAGKLSWYARVVLTTTLFLIVAGWLGIYCAEFSGFNRTLPATNAILAALFQSVTCRTAGFNTLDISQMTNVSLLIMVLLMFIGGAPGSCAGGIKVTTFRAITAFAVTQLLGRKQAVVGRFAVDREAMNRAVILLVFSVGIVFTAALLLNITEGGDIPHPLARGLALEIVYEVVSAFGTVGLSMGLTTKLTVAGKCIVTMLMFIGRLGPILFLVAIQNLQKERFFSWPEENLLIG